MGESDTSARNNRPRARRCRRGDEHKDGPKGAACEFPRITRRLLQLVGDTNHVRRPNAPTVLVLGGLNPEQKSNELRASGLR